MLQRRTMLTIGATAVGGAALAPVLGRLGAAAGELPAAPPADHSAHANHQATALETRVTVAPEFVPFSVRMPVPRELAPKRRTRAADEYEVDITATTAELVPGIQTPVFAYGGSFVGPTIRAKTGRPVAVTFRNRLDREANVHLHGGHVPATSDGHPMDLIAPGAAKRYEYPNSQRGATLWYHDHSHGTESENVYRGLHGFYLIEDDAERHLNLPRGAYDVPIMLTSAQFDETGAMVYGNPGLRTTILLNGKAQPHFPVAARKYRFRLLNATNEGVFRLSLGGAPLTQVGTDQGLLPAPVPRTEIKFGSGERVDVVVDFSGLPVGTQLMLTDATSGGLLRFDVTQRAHDDSRLPQVLRPLPPVPPAVREREVVLSFDLAGPMPQGLVNGQTYDPDRVDFQIKEGTTEIWRIVNGDGGFGFLHNFHLHLTNFRVLDRDGVPPSIDDLGLKDTVSVPPGTSVRVAATFAGFLGRYAYHCHFLEHSSVGMMAQMEIVP
ncbi:spore coat protein A [Catellatospora sp. TT07R-123]|uniref:multicopper oxidase family protein n=1 Tax=Catellatospora sp. TT07R-123 TaxID=2733863 RepID=UPI001B21AA91|nr:multicopper oxidase family protein [Catellatospora sp. TT07R-123]GHJ44207.1 spore coat protein A [Catellatospora sp. TT07R-123]